MMMAVDEVVRGVIVVRTRCSAEDFVFGCDFG